MIYRDVWLWYKVCLFLLAFCWGSSFPKNPSQKTMYSSSLLTYENINTSDAWVTRSRRRPQEKIRRPSWNPEGSSQSRAAFRLHGKSVCYQMKHWWRRYANMFCRVSPLLGAKVFSLYNDLGSFWKWLVEMGFIVNHWSLWAASTWKSPLCRLRGRRLQFWALRFSALLWMGDFTVWKAEKINASMLSLITINQSILCAGATWLQNESVCF